MGDANVVLPRNGHGHMYVDDLETLGVTLFS